MTLLIIIIQTLQVRCTLRSSLIYTSGNVVYLFICKEFSIQDTSTAHSERQTAYELDEAAAVVNVGNTIFFSFYELP